MAGIVTNESQGRDKMSSYLYMAYVQNLHTLRELNFNKPMYRIIRRTLIFLNLFSGVSLHDPKTSSTNQAKSIHSGRRKTSQSGEVQNSILWSTLCARPCFNRLKVSEQPRRQKIDKRKTSKIKRTNKITLGLYYLFTIHLILNLFYQYTYDFNLMRLTRLRERSFADTNATSEYERELMMNLERARTNLRIIGAPYMEKSIIIEATYLFIVLVAFAGFYFNHTLYRYSSTYECHAIFDYLDLKDEENHLKRLVKAQVVSFMASERQFVRIQSSLFNRELLTSHPADFQFSHGSLSNQEHVKYNKHRQTLDTGLVQYRYEQGAAPDFSLSGSRGLVKMLNCGALTPFNRTLEWFVMRTKIALAYQGITLLYLAIFSAAIVVAAVLDKDSLLMLSSISDITIRLTTFGLMTFSSVSLCLFGSNTIMSALDQIVSIKTLLRQVEQCIQLNVEEFFTRLHPQLKKNDGQHRIDQQPAASDNGSTVLSVNNGWACSLLNLPNLNVQSKRNCGRTRDDQQVLSPNQYLDQQDYRFGCDKMNSNLLFILMHYKIFVAQSVCVIKPLNPELINVTILLMLTPAIARIHQPYFQVFHMMDVKTYAVGLSTLVLLPANMTLLVLCYFHSRCNDLYRALSSLMAHIIETESCLPASKAIYNRHMLRMLSKELSYPETFLNQFMGRYSWTYTMVLKIHFWLGLIIISILSRTEMSGQGFFDSFFNDPLGVF